MNFFKHHAQHFSYTNDLLTIDIFGGVEGSLMDGLYATLKISLADSSRPPIRHNLDLFNDNQMTRLITKICERLEIGHSVVSASLSEVVEYLEAERLKEFTANEPAILKPLDKEDEKTAIKALNYTDLMDRTYRAFEVIGICGEARNAMILYLAMLSRKLPEPLSVICMAKSGSGKSYLVDKIAACLPPSDLLPHTQLTAASLYHFPKNELAGKVLLLEDLTSAKEAMYPIMGLHNKKKISKTMTIKDRTGELRTATFTVEGQLCVVACSSYDKIYADHANQCLLLSLDSSLAQDKRIMDYQKQLRAGQIDEHAIYLTQKKLQHMQQALDPILIINPFAPLIELPQQTQNPRRTLPLILNFIDAITFYHQHQRPSKVDTQSGEVYIETDPLDIQFAFDLLEEVLFVKSDELSASARSFYQWLCDWVKSSEVNTGKTTSPAVGSFYATTIRENLKIHPRTLSRHLKELTEYGFLKITGGNRHTTGYSYAINKREQPTDGLTDSIQKQLDAVMDRINEAAAKSSKPVPARPDSSGSTRESDGKQTAPKPKTNSPKPDQPAPSTRRSAKPKTPPK